MIGAAKWVGWVLALDVLFYLLGRAAEKQMEGPAIVIVLCAMGWMALINFPPYIISYILDTILRGIMGKQISWAGGPMAWHFYIPLQIIMWGFIGFMCTKKTRSQ